ncbi:reverse transcriptase domain-containing protein [Tanacetum coccineum]
MAGTVDEGGPEGTDDREVTPHSLIKEQIEGHVSALKSLIKDHNQRNKVDPIRLNFELEDTEVHDQHITKGKEVVDEDLRKPFMKARRTPLTRRIIEFAGPKYKMPTNIKLYDGTMDPEDQLSHFAGAANSGEWPMHVWCRMFQQTLDRSAKGWFERLPPNSINEWAYLREAFAARYSVWRACFKEPRKITKIVKKVNELLTAFKERWTVETGFIMGVPEVMKMSSFIGAVKSLELAKHFSNKVPVTVNEMMVRLDDFVISKEAYASTELPKWEAKPPSERCKIERKEISWKICSSTGEDNQCDQCKLEDISDEPLIVEAEVEGYLVRWEYVDEGSSVEVMYEHCFKNLNPRIKAKLRETQTDLVGFAGKISKLLGKIELEVCFGNNDLCRRTSMKFIVVRAPSPYNIILGRPGLKTLRAIPSTIHSMMKFPTPKGIATLVTQSVIIVECRHQWEAIDGRLTKACRDQLKCLLKDNMGVFAWEPSDMTGSQIGWNLEAYVDDMVIKSKDENMLLADIAETFDNLKEINMKLNPKKCSFEVEEGKFIGYMVTSEGIMANPKKTKALADL